MSTRRHRQKVQRFNARRRERSRQNALMQPRHITIVLSSHEDWDAAILHQGDDGVVTVADVRNRALVLASISVGTPSEAP